MGKKARKTRWRTLEITDEQSDSEESHIATSPRLPKSFQQKSYYNKLPYSSQSTPRRKYQHESTKSTRSSSTASENKIIFNEDEYTRITTPRQDVLFKKGYLNKPKNYQTQTSTGTSTTSTGNSTGNGTPDHQSTDLEYDSQFVFPNGFVDQNGIYYVNSFEPYPLMLYNPPTYYTECSNSKTKRYSTGSLTESTSPNNEEATSQDLSGGEASNNVSDYSGQHGVYNMVYPGYYINGVCPHQEVNISEYPTDQTRKIKKRRRRKTSRSQTNNQDSTECSEDEESEPIEPENSTVKPTVNSAVPTSNSTDCPTTEETPKINDHSEKRPEDDTEIENTSKTPVLLNSTSSPDEENSCTELPKPQKYDLKPDAEEFIPRAFRTPEIPLSPVQFIKVPPNFVPIPVVPFNGQVNPAFIPPGGIPINFLPPDPKMFPNFINFVPTPLKNENTTEKIEEIKDVIANDQNSQVCGTNSNIGKSDTPAKVERTTEKIITNGKTIDIATVVSKLQEAAKEQEENKEDKPTNNDSEYSPKKKPFKINPKYRNNFKRNFYNSPRSSPQRQNGEVPVQHVSESNEFKHIVNNTQIEVQTDAEFIRTSPERFRKNWKTYQNGNSRWQQNGVHRSPKQNQRLLTNGELKQTVRHYAETVKSSVVAKTVDNVQLELPKTLPLTSSPKVCPPKLPDQWISVSSRKKRKNKNVDESDASFDDTTPIEEDKDDQFQSYDVNLLVDVIPPSKIEDETLTVEITEDKIEEIINNIAQTESDSIQNNCLTPDVRSVTEIENEMITKEETPKEETSKEETLTEERIEVKEETQKEELTEVKEEILPVNIIEQETEIVKNILEDTKSSKKKSKKNSQKPATKRVIITDIDLSDKREEPKTPLKKVVRKIDKPKETPEIKDEEVEETVTKVETTEDPEEKKAKKKKKKSSKAAVTNSLSSSTTALSIAEDAYEILLDTSLAIEADKTNDEMSVELDKLIQKGMYSNLEEKMKSLNITEGDGFFKSVFSKIPLSGRTEATGFLKSPDFTKIPLYKSDPVSEDQSLESKKTNEQLPASESPEIFLEIPDHHPEKTHEVPEETKSLYPITEAVKEWMCRTRETTPDVEIFKSPMTIYKEFCDSDTNSDTEVCGNVLSDELSVSVDDEEITLFTTEDAKSREGSNEDLLEYWEDLKSDDKKTDKTNGELNRSNDEEELEIYESKYGKNEDFLNLQKEIKEKSNMTFPKHSNLPYRAICCNIM